MVRSTVSVSENIQHSTNEQLVLLSLEAANIFLLKFYSGKYVSQVQ